MYVNLTNDCVFITAIDPRQLEYTIDNFFIMLPTAYKGRLVKFLSFISITKQYCYMTPGTKQSETTKLSNVLKAQ